MIVRALGDQKSAALDYLSRRLQMPVQDIAAFDLCDVYLACKCNDALGVILYKNLASGDVEMICAGEPGWVSRPMLKFVLSHPFEAYGCQRVTCLATRKNKAMRSYLHRMGFKLEGVKRRALNGADVFIYGLLKGEQRWA